MNDGEWFQVEPRPGSIVVNIGMLLSQLTCGKLKATTHRVRDIGRDRFSVPFFFEARSDAEFEIPAMDQPSGSKKTIIYGPWTVNCLKNFPCDVYKHLPSIDHLYIKEK